MGYMFFGYIGPNFGGNKNLFNPKNTIVFFETDLKGMNGAYPFGERVDDDFAIGG